MYETHLSHPAPPTRAAPDSNDHVAAVQLSSLTKSYGAVRAVDDLTLRVERGEIVAVLGPNGAGKSTAAELILGLAKPDAGSATVFGLDPLAAVRSGRVGAMLQSGALLADTRVIDILELMSGLHAQPLAVTEVIARAGLGGFLKTKTDRLSGGQAQRLRYALALLPDPDLLILDEPTVGMDVEARREFWRSMREFADGREDGPVHDPLPRRGRCLRRPNRRARRRAGSWPREPATRSARASRGAPSRSPPSASTRLPCARCPASSRS